MERQGDGETDRHIDRQIDRWCHRYASLHFVTSKRAPRNLQDGQPSDGARRSLEEERFIHLHLHLHYIHIRISMPVINHA